MADPRSENPHAILGVPESASPVEIRTAYRQLARRFHPDVAGGDAARMAAINRAYARLMGESAPPPAEPRTAPTPPTGRERPIWADDLDVHADDWRQMLEEERHGWESLLASGAPDPARRAHLERELGRARQAQVELENALRAREGLPPMDEATFEAERARRPEALTRHAGGCLVLLVVPVWRLLGLG